MKRRGEWEEESGVKRFHTKYEIFFFEREKVLLSNAL